MPISNNVFPQGSGVGSITLQNDISDVTSTNKATTPKYVKDLIDEYILDPTVLAAAFGASTNNIALTGPVVYEGLTIPSGVRWLAAGQTDPITNGVFITDDAGDWTRATDADTAIELHLAQITAVNGDAGQYLCTISKTATVGTDPVTFIELYKADDQYVGIELYNATKVYNQNTLVVNPSVSEYIWRCLIDGTNNIVPSMASANWEIYQGLLYQNSAVVAPNGNDSKSVGFPYATYAGAIADLSTGAYIEGRAVTTIEAVTPKAGMYLSGKNAQISKVVLSSNDVTIDSLNLLGSVANPVPISITGSTNSTIRNLTATANGASNSIEVTSTWDGVHRISGLRLTGNINIAGTTTTGVFVFSDILSTLTLTLNCANARVYIQNCPNFTLVETAGEIIADVNPNLIYVATTGLDTNNGSSYYTAKKTLASAAALAGNSGKQIVVYPGTYAENTTLTNLNLSIFGANIEEGGLVNFSGTITFNPASSSTRVSGVSFNNLVKQGAGALYLESCKTDTFADSGSGYLEMQDCDTQGSGAGTVSITGAGTKNFLTDCKTGITTINNASALVVLSRQVAVASVTVTTGNLVVGGDSAIYSLTEGGNAISILAGTLQIQGMTALTPTNAAARINIAAGVVYNITQASYDVANSTISSSAISMNSNMTINAQTDRIGTLTAAGTIPTTQELTICTAATATYLVTLPSASISRGRLFKVKNSSASTFAVTITVNSITYSIQPDEAILVESDGSNFRTIALPVSAMALSTIYSIVNANTNAVAGTTYACNGNSAAFTITLPSLPRDGDTIKIYDNNTTFGIWNVTINRNGKNIGGVASNFVCNIPGQAITLVYNLANNNWLIVENVQAASAIAEFTFQSGGAQTGTFTAGVTPIQFDVVPIKARGTGVVYSSNTFTLTIGRLWELTTNIPCIENFGSATRLAYQWYDVTSGATAIGMAAASVGTANGAFNAETGSAIAYVDLRGAASSKNVQLRVASPDSVRSIGISNAAADGFTAANSMPTVFFKAIF
jgi:hypothetical protein